MNADEFNALYPVGTPVVAYPGVRPEYGLTTAKRLITRTRSVAWPLGDGTPVVKVDGCAGGIALQHVDPFSLSDYSPQASAARNVPKNPRPLCRNFQPKPEPAEYWCANCHWNAPMHDNESERTSIAVALESLPEGIEPL